MRFLLDQGLPRSTIAHLASVGLDSEHAGDLGLALASDSTILEEGRRRDAVVVTLDSDFHALLAQSNGPVRGANPNAGIKGCRHSSDPSRGRGSGG